MSRALARQVGPKIEEACAPHQYALSTRAGTDCVGHVIRALTDANLGLTLLSIDGVGAYDHVLRSSMLSSLLEVPGARDIIPYVMLSYGQPSRYAWADEDGTQQWIQQAEGVEPTKASRFSTARRRVSARQQSCF